MKTPRITHTGNAAVKVLTLFVGLTISLLVSCNKENAAPDFTAEETESTNSEAVESSYLDDADDLASVSLDGESVSGGKFSSDERLACATVTRDGDNASGTVRVDFETGCTDPRGNVRLGAMIIVYKGRWNEAGAHWSITFDHYSVNGVGIEGKRDVMVTSATDSLITSEVVFTDGRLTWPDGRVASREVHHKREHERHGNHLLDRLIIYGSAQGTDRNGRGYTIEILERLVYRRACAAQGVIIPVSGVKLIKHGDRELTIDYGDGTCDNFVTITNKNGRTIRYEVGK